MLKLLTTLRPSVAIAATIGAVAMGTFVQANPANPAAQSVQAKHTANSTTGTRRYGSGHVALEKQVETVSGESELALAEHLVKSGAKFYGAYWCSHCSKQKSLFGAVAAAKLPYIECAKDGVDSQRALCAQKKIQMFPSWVVDGKIFPGTRELKDIAELTGYQGPMNFKYRK